MRRIEGRYLMTPFAQSLRNSQSRGERNVAFGGRSAQKHGNSHVGWQCSGSCPAPTRLACNRGSRSLAVRIEGTIGTLRKPRDRRGLFPHPHHILWRGWRAGYTEFDGEQHGVSDATIAPSSRPERQPGGATECGRVKVSEGGVFGYLR